MFAVNPSAPHIYQGSYPSYPVFPSQLSLNWSHVPSFGEQNSFGHMPTTGMHGPFSSIPTTTLGSIASSSNQNWSYVPQTSVRSIPPPSPSVYTSYNMGPLTPGPLYSSHSSIGGPSELSKSDLYSSSSSLNNGGVQLPSAEQSPLTLSASIQKNEPSKKISNRIHETSAAAGLRNAVLNSDQAQEYFRMKQNGTLPQAGLRGQRKPVQENTLFLSTQISSDVSRSPTQLPMLISGVASPWNKSPPGI